MTCTNAATTAVRPEPCHSPSLTPWTRPEPETGPNTRPAARLAALHPAAGITRPHAGFNPPQARTARHSLIPATAPLRVLPRRGPAMAPASSAHLPASRPWFPATSTSVAAGQARNQPSIRPAYAAPERPAHQPRAPPARVPVCTALARPQHPPRLYRPRAGHRAPDTGYIRRPDPLRGPQAACNAAVVPQGHETRPRPREGHTDRASAKDQLRHRIRLHRPHRVLLPHCLHRAPCTPPWNAQHISRCGRGYSC